MRKLSKILLIGVDAADKDLLLDWAGAGILPTFQLLSREATWGLIRNPVGFYVGAVWPSFFTGLSPSRHGRYCYRQIRSGSYEITSFRASEIKAEPFWAGLDRLGKRVAVIDVPKTFLCNDFNGLQIVDWGTHDPDPAGFCASPPSVGEEIISRFGRDPVGICDRKRTSAAQFELLRDQLVQRVEIKTDLSRYFLDRGEWDLFLTVFSESHCVGHQCWHLHDVSHPRHDPMIAGSIGDPIKDVYRATDAAIGALLKHVGSETDVVVLASHGMGPHYDATFILGEMLERIEKMRLSNPKRRIAGVVRWCWNKLPARLRVNLRPLRTPIRRTIGQIVPTPDIGTRKCFEVPNNDVYGGIRINLAGREPNGRVRPGHEFDNFCEALTRDLLSFVNLETGKPLVRNVIRTADFYEGEQIAELPDLLVEWDRVAPISRVYSDVTGTIEGKYRGIRSGDHKPDGVFFAVGPSFGAGRLDSSVSIMDFAPTVADLLGVSLPRVDGVSLSREYRQAM